MAGAVPVPTEGMCTEKAPAGGAKYCESLEDIL